MSDTPQGAGWWQASDGKWYPPEQQPGTEDAPPPPDERSTAAPTGASESTDDGPASGGETPPRAETAPPAPLAGSDEGSGGNRRVIVAVVAVVALAAAAFAAFTLLGDDEASASEVTLESLGAAGSDPYTAPVAPAPSAKLADFAESGPPEGAEVAEVSTDEDTGYETADGSVPAIFGGTLDEYACDADQLVSFLDAEPAKAAVWASVLEIDPADIAAYVDGLTPTNLTVDTRVLNHGFAEGDSVPRESLLQRGTAVFVDTRGVPRVNCYSGNPLREPEVVSDETFVGNRWDSFDESQVLVVRPAPADIDEFELLDYETGQRFSRPAGKADTSGGEPDDDATQDLPADRQIEANTLIEDEITEARPEVRYTIDIPDSAVVTLSLTNDRESINRFLVSFGTPGTQVDAFRVAPGADDERTYVLAHDEGGVYELNFSEGPAAYEFEVGVEVQDDGGSGGDAGDDVSSAVELESGDDVTGLLGGSDRTDQYSLQLEPGTELRLTVANARTSESRFLLQLVFEGSQLYSQRIAPGADDEYSILLSPDDDGILDITVSEGPSDYSFTVELVAQEDGGEPGDAGGELATARELTQLSAVTGEVGDRDDADAYLFDAPAAAVDVTVTVDAESDNRVLVQVFAPDGSQKASFRVAPGATETGSFEATVGEQYQLVVSEGRARYTMDIGEQGATADG